MPVSDGAREYARDVRAADGEPIVSELVQRARRDWQSFRRAHGYTGDAPLLTPPTSQPKLGKSRVPTFGLMLTPERGVGLDGVNLCPAATACAQVCLASAGKGGMANVQRARHVRTLWILQSPYHAGVLLLWEILRASKRHGEIRVRLNVTSDIRHELTSRSLIWHARMLSNWTDVSDPLVSFYDYSAWDRRHREPLEGYHLTYSRKERGVLSRPDVLAGILEDGGNVSAVFARKRGEPLPDTYLGHPVIDGDLGDDRTLDPSGVVVGLRAKGSAVRDTSGFVLA